ncbi:histidine phosphatase family protein [Virgibacillus siamensis]|uniref:histidine phosphatase family protein n=1 Tax=Virgibacillus siamensis TaxID=480071 RepID=UPI0009873FCF|nr:histidine phosphatase family protein [Virgibacillus siamensis]
MKNLYIIRHCLADGQHIDSPLTDVGMRQAHLLSVYLSEKDIKIDKIISSPYLRAIESIRPFAEKNKLKINVDDRLKERILSDEPIDDWMEVLEKSFSDHDFQLPGGESGNDVIKRASMVIDAVNNEEDISNVLIVSHGNLIALLLGMYNPDFGFEGWKNLQNPDVFLINLEENEHSIKSLWTK